MNSFCIWKMWELRWISIIQLNLFLIWKVYLDYNSPWRKCIWCARCDCPPRIPGCPPCTVDWWRWWSGSRAVKKAVLSSTWLILREQYVKRCGSRLTYIHQVTVFPPVHVHVSHWIIQDVNLSRESWPVSRCVFVVDLNLAVSLGKAAYSWLETAFCEEVCEGKNLCRNVGGISYKHVSW